MNVSPVVRMKGTVHNAQLRSVDAVEALPAERDPETGRIVREAREAREGYDVLDVTVHTEEGGYALVLLKGEHLEKCLGGAVPVKGDDVDWPVRNYIAWAGRAGRRYPTVGYSVAGDVLASEVAASNGGRRLAEVAN